MSEHQSRPGASPQRYSPELPYRPRVSPPSVEDRDACAIYATVRKDAIDDALARAREYAEAVGARVDRLVEISDEGAGGGVHPMMMRSAGFKDEAPALELDPQPQTVQASVIVRVTITEPAIN